MLGDACESLRQGFYFHIKMLLEEIPRREVRDEYPSFFFVPFGIGILYPCAACHDLYQEGWQQFSCIMVLMVFGIEIMEGFFFHLFFLLFCLHVI